MDHKGTPPWPRPLGQLDRSRESQLKPVIKMVYPEPYCKKRRLLSFMVGIVFQPWNVSCRNMSRTVKTRQPRRSCPIPFIYPGFAFDFPGARSPTCCSCRSPRRGSCRGPRPTAPCQRRRPRPPSPPGTSKGSISPGRLFVTLGRGKIRGQTRHKNMGLLAGKPRKKRENMSSRDSVVKSSFL